MPATNKSDSPPPDELRTLVRDLRRELIIEKTQVLELQDRVRAQQTENSDAVALLGQAELLLEQKIAYILKLDQSLTGRIRELEDECDRKTSEIDNRGKLITELQATDENNRHERDTIINQLREQLEASNQEVGKAHEIARDIDLQRHEQAVARETAEKLQHETHTQLQETSAKAAQLESDLQATSVTCDQLAKETEKLQRDLRAKCQELEETTANLQSTSSNLAVTSERLKVIESSRWWKLGLAWRTLFGPKL